MSNELDWSQLVLFDDRPTLDEQDALGSQALLVAAIANQLQESLEKPARPPFWAGWFGNPSQGQTSLFQRAALLADHLHHALTAPPSPPLRLGLFGGFGQGKTSILKQVEARLQRTCRIGGFLFRHAPRFRWFDAAQYPSASLEFEFDRLVGRWFLFKQRSLLFQTSSLLVGIVTGVSIFKAILDFLPPLESPDRVSAFINNLSKVEIWQHLYQSFSTVATVSLLLLPVLFFPLLRHFIRDSERSQLLQPTILWVRLWKILREVWPPPDVLVIDNLDRASLDQQRAVLRAMNKHSEHFHVATVVTMDVEDLLRSPPNPEAPEELLRKCLTAECRLPLRIGEDVPSLLHDLTRTAYRLNRHNGAARVFQDPQVLGDWARLFSLLPSFSPRRIKRFLNDLLMSCRTMKVEEFNDMAALARLLALYDLLPSLRQNGEALVRVMANNDIVQFKQMTPVDLKEEARSNIVRLFAMTRHMQPTDRNWRPLIGRLFTGLAEAQPGRVLPDVALRELRQAREEFSFDLENLLPIRPLPSPEPEDPSPLPAQPGWLWRIRNTKDRTPGQLQRILTEITATPNSIKKKVQIFLRKLVDKPTDDSQESIPDTTMAWIYLETVLCEPAVAAIDRWRQYTHWETEVLNEKYQRQSSDGLKNAQRRLYRLWLADAEALEVVSAQKRTELIEKVSKMPLCRQLLFNLPGRMLSLPQRVQICVTEFITVRDKLVLQQWLAERAIDSDQAYFKLQFSSPDTATVDHAWPRLPPIQQELVYHWDAYHTLLVKCDIRLTPEPLQKALNDPQNGERALRLLLTKFFQNDDQDDRLHAIKNLYLSMLITQATSINSLITQVPCSRPSFDSSIETRAILWGSLYFSCLHGDISLFNKIYHHSRIERRERNILLHLLAHMDQDKARPFLEELSKDPQRLQTIILPTRSTTNPVSPVFHQLFLPLPQYPQLLATIGTAIDPPDLPQLTRRHSSRQPVPSYYAVLSARVAANGNHPAPAEAINHMVNQLVTLSDSATDIALRNRSIRDAVLLVNGSWTVDPCWNFTLVNELNITPHPAFSNYDMSRLQALLTQAQRDTPSDFDALLQTPSSVTPGNRFYSPYLVHGLQLENEIAQQFDARLASFANWCGPGGNNFHTAELYNLYSWIKEIPENSWQSLIPPISSGRPTQVNEVVWSNGLWLGNLMDWFAQRCNNLDPNSLQCDLEWSAAGPQFVVRSPPPPPRKPRGNFPIQPPVQVSN